jgi:hypothetical protein
MKRVLSISGGGMRGIGPVRILQEVEKRTNREIGDIFDLVVGTSTGGIVSCLVGAGVPMGDAANFYYEHGPKIFQSSLLEKASCGGGLWGARYESMDLASALTECLGNRMMREAKTRVMVTTVDDSGVSDMVKSWDPDWRDCPLSLAALMTASAPTFFAPATIMHDGKKMCYLDGGLVRNAPMACAIFEAGRLWYATGEQILVVHLGTGRPRKAERLPHGGGLAWAPRIFDAMTMADDSYDDYFCRTLEGFLPQFSYQNFDFTLPKFPAMDDARRETLDNIAAAAWHATLAEWKRFDAVLEALK